MATSHEEADTMIAQQAIMCAKRQPDAISVIADDTDVIVLLLHHYQNEGSYDVTSFHVHDITGSVKV